MNCIVEKLIKRVYVSNLKYDCIEMKIVKNRVGQLLTNEPESKQSKEAVNFCRKLYTVSVEKISERDSVVFKHGVESFVDNIWTFCSAS